MAVRIFNKKEYASSWDHLATRVGCAPKTLQRLDGAPGSPGRTENGWLDIEAWKKFYEQAQSERKAVREIPPEKKDQLAEARLRRARATAEKEELNVAKMKGELLDAGEVNAEIRGAWAFEQNCLKSALASYPKLTPADAQQIFDDFVKLCREYKTELIDHAESQSEIQ